MRISLKIKKCIQNRGTQEILKTNNVYKRKKFLPEKLTTYSMGMFVLFFGTKKQYNNIAHHSIWLGKRFKGLLKDIFDNKVLSNTGFQFCFRGYLYFYSSCTIQRLLSSFLS